METKSRTRKDQMLGEFGNNKPKCTTDHKTSKVVSLNPVLDQLKLADHKLTDSNIRYV